MHDFEKTGVYIKGSFSKVNLFLPSDYKFCLSSKFGGTIVKIYLLVYEISSLEFAFGFLLSVFIYFVISVFNIGICNIFGESVNIGNIYLMEKYTIVLVYMY